MVSLVDILAERTGNPKMIIMAGGAGAGKTRLLKQLRPLLRGFEIINPDKYVEDPNSDMYNNLTKASGQVDDKDVPAAIESRKNFVWDTTASNAAKMVGGLYRRKQVPGILNQDNYDHLMIMVYAHPIVSFIRNFERERKVPKIGVIGTWNSVYGNIEAYKQKLGDNFLLYRAPAPELEDEIRAFDEAAKQGKIKEYLDELIGANPDKYASTFRKEEPQDLTPEEKAKREQSRLNQKELLDKQIEVLSKQFEKISSEVEGMVVTKDTVAQKVKQFITS